MIDTNWIIGTLLGAIGAMGGLFAFILRDAIARNDKLTERNDKLLDRLDARDKVVADMVSTLGTAVEAVQNQKHLYDALQVVKDVTEEFKKNNTNQQQLFTAIEQLHNATEWVEDNRPAGRNRGPGK